jgi:uncharacterized membrane protein
MIELLAGTKVMMIIDSIVAIIVFVAIMVDLGAGLYKASLRGDARRSEALKRTGFKFCLYHGSILIAAGIDLLIHLSRLYMWFGWNIVYGLPLITIVLGIYWCVVEFMSVREKADEKTHSDMAKAEKMAKALLKIVEAIKKGEVPDNDLIDEFGKDLHSETKKES